MKVMPRSMALRMIRMLLGFVARLSDVIAAQADRATPSRRSGPACDRACRPAWRSAGRRPAPRRRGRARAAPATREASAAPATPSSAVVRSSSRRVVSDGRLPPTLSAAARLSTRFLTGVALSPSRDHAARVAPRWRTAKLKPNVMPRSGLPDAHSLPPCASMIDAADRQPHPEAAGLGGEERIEDALPDARRHADARVPDAHLDGLPATAHRRPDDQLVRRRAGLARSPRGRCAAGSGSPAPPGCGRSRTQRQLRVELQTRSIDAAARHPGSIRWAASRTTPLTSAGSRFASPWRTKSRIRRMISPARKPSAAMRVTASRRSSGAQSAFPQAARRCRWRS